MVDVSVRRSKAKSGVVMCELSDSDPDDSPVCFSRNDYVLMGEKKDGGPICLQILCCESSPNAKRMGIDILVGSGDPVRYLKRLITAHLRKTFPETAHLSVKHLYQNGYVLSSHATEVMRHRFPGFGPHSLVAELGAKNSRICQPGFSFGTGNVGHSRPSEYRSSALQSGGSSPVQPALTSRTLKRKALEGPNFQNDGTNSHNIDGSRASTHHAKKSRSSSAKIQSSSSSNVANESDPLSLLLAKPPQNGSKLLEPTDVRTEDQVKTFLLQRGITEFPVGKKLRELGIFGQVKRLGGIRRVSANIGMIQQHGFFNTDTAVFTPIKVDGTKAAADKPSSYESSKPQIYETSEQSISGPSQQSISSKSQQSTSKQPKSLITDQSAPSSCKTLISESSKLSTSEEAKLQKAVPSKQSAAKKSASKPSISESSKQSIPDSSKPSISEPSKPSISGVSSEEQDENSAVKAGKEEECPSKDDSAMKTDKSKHKKKKDKKKKKKKKRKKSDGEKKKKKKSGGEKKKQKKSDGEKKKMKKDKSHKTTEEGKEQSGDKSPIRGSDAELEYPASPASRGSTYVPVSQFLTQADPGDSFADKLNLKNSNFLGRLATETTISQAETELNFSGDNTYDSESENERPSRLLSKLVYPPKPSKSEKAAKSKIQNPVSKSNENSSGESSDESDSDQSGSDADIAEMFGQ
eukprot:208200_1